MYDFGEISLTCLTKYPNFFELVKSWQIIKLNARYLENKTKLRMSFRNYFNYYIRTGYSKHWKVNTTRHISFHYVSCVNKTTCYKICKQNASTKRLFLFCLFYFYFFVVYKIILILPFVSFFWVYMCWISSSNHAPFRI
jgi:predicted nucleotidyltransferase